MKFRGTQLVTILRQQWPDCLVEIRTESGAETVSPAVAAEVVACSACVGVGHHRRILYIAPTALGLWRGRKTTVRERREDGTYLGGRTAPGRIGPSGRSRPAVDLAVRHVSDNVRHGTPDPAWCSEPVRPGAIDVKMGAPRPDAKPMSGEAAYLHCFGHLEGESKRVHKIAVHEIGAHLFGTTKEIQVSKCDCSAGLVHKHGTPPNMCDVERYVRDGLSIPCSCSEGDYWRQRVTRP